MPTVVELQMSIVAAICKLQNEEVVIREDSYEHQELRRIELELWELLDYIEEESNG